MDNNELGNNNPPAQVPPPAQPVPPREGKRVQQGPPARSGAAGGARLARPEGGQAPQGGGMPGVQPMQGAPAQRMPAVQPGGPQRRPAGELRPAGQLPPQPTAQRKAAYTPKPAPVPGNSGYQPRPAGQLPAKPAPRQGAAPQPQPQAAYDPYSTRRLDYPVPHQTVTETPDVQAKKGEPPERKLSKHEGPPPHKALHMFLYIAFVIGLSSFLAVFAWVSVNDVLGLMKEEKVATVVVPEDFTIDYVAGALKEAGLIEYPFLFKLYCNISDAQDKIDPGTYDIQGNLDYRAMVYSMRKTSEARTIITVTIPEGYDNGQIFDLLEEKGVCKRYFLELLATYAEFDYEFLDGIKKGKNRFEGYLFPDTYDFYINENPTNVLKKLLGNFERKYTENFARRAEELGLTTHQAVTIASLIERETAVGEERPIVSSVIFNRLRSTTMRRLEIDATVQYALGEHKAALTYADLEIDSPYNTYLYEGLPPGPIACPGIASLKAALWPDETDYYFYALYNGERTHKFSKTKDEHDAFVAEQRAER